MQNRWECISAQQLGKQPVTAVVLPLHPSSNCREELVEKQKQILEENEQLRKQLNDAEMQLEIFEIEQSTLQEKKTKEEKQKAMIAENAKQEQLYEQDREFVSTLLTDIWRGTIVLQLFSVDSITPTNESRGDREL